MTKKLKEINPDTLEVQKKRARLATVHLFHEAYEHAHKNYGLSKKEFAARIGMKASHFSRILSGAQNVTVETSEAVLRALNHRLTVEAVPLDDLETVSSNRYCRNEEIAVSYGNADTSKRTRRYELSEELAD